MPHNNSQQYLVNSSVRLFSIHRLSTLSLKYMVPQHSLPHGFLIVTRNCSLMFPNFFRVPSCTKKANLQARLWQSLFQEVSRCQLLLFCRKKKQARFAAQPREVTNKFWVEALGFPVTTHMVLCLPAAGTSQESHDVSNFDMHFAFARTWGRFLKTTFRSTLAVLGATRIRKTFCS